MKTLVLVITLGLLLCTSMAPAQPKADADDIHDDIRDIRGPIHVPDPRLWLAYAAGVLAAGGLGYGLYRLLGRRSVRVLSAYEIALQRLEQARRLMLPDRGKEFSVAVSEAVREYIEQRFPVRAARRTTEEFLRDLVEQEGTPLGAWKQQLGDFLRHCDLAKFARYYLSQKDMEEMYGSARTFVDRTRPEAQGEGR